MIESIKRYTDMLKEKSTNSLSTLRQKPKNPLHNLKLSSSKNMKDIILYYLLA